MVKNQFSYTKSKLLDLFDLEIRDVKKSEQYLFENKNILWKKTTKILYHTIADVYTFLHDTKEGKDLLKKNKEKKVEKIIFAQTDNYSVDFYEQHIYEILESLYLSKYDIEIYDTGFLKDNFNLWEDDYSYNTEFGDGRTEEEMQTIDQIIGLT